MQTYVQKHILSYAVLLHSLFQSSLRALHIPFYSYEKSSIVLTVVI